MVLAVVNIVVEVVLSPALHGCIVHA
jgi:hypothetical protein